MIHDQTKKYEWDAIEFQHREKSTDWYWGLGIIVVTAIILSIISKNYLLAVLVLFGGVLLGFFADKKPHPVHVELSERGIKMDNDLYTYETVPAFWMYIDHKNHHRLIIITGRPVMPERIITLPDEIKANNIRGYLKQFVEEKEIKPSLIHTLAESFGL